jgi:hypothetical protein
VPVGDTGRPHCAELGASKGLHDNYGMTRVHPQIIYVRSVLEPVLSPPSFLHYDRVANVDRVEVPLCVLRAQTDATVADIVVPK